MAKDVLANLRIIGLPAVAEIQQLHLEPAGPANGCKSPIIRGTGY
jgi:hypothetical protein